MSLPIAITMGDPAGIGPEVLARFLGQRGDANGLVLYGARWALEMGADVAGVRLPDVTLRSFSKAPPADFRMGQVQAAAGALAVASVEAAARDCLDGRVAAMVTCPINKAAIHEAGFVDDLGHQEILARLSGASWTATMLMTPGLKVAHLSTHKSLIEAARYVTRANVLGKLQLLDETLNRWGLKRARIAVAALNPHGGESGLLGGEEIDEIEPAVADAAAAGIQAFGPIPADSVFYRAIDGEFDVVLALYHDQGHIAIKVHDFHRSTTATLGIPFVRTSVDHGTAFDIAGAGQADARGLKAAVESAEAIVSGRLGALD